MMTWSRSPTTVWHTRPVLWPTPTRTQGNWTWSSDHSAGFVIRRLAQEIGVHRWDAELAAGIEHTIEATLASDGIDEFLHHFHR